MEKFFDYFDGRYREGVLGQPSVNDGPVITLSRQTGCDARQVAEALVEELNLRYDTNKWKWVDKDIIYSIAKELNTDTQRVENFYKGIELSNLSEMIMAFSGGFVSDLRVKKAIRDVVTSMCKDGHLVLVGRGGVAIAHNMTNALHIKIVAPHRWRVENIASKMKMDIKKAEDYVAVTDEKRQNLIKAFLEKKFSDMDSLFDASINRQTFSIREIAELVLKMYERKVGSRISATRSFSASF